MLYYSPVFILSFFCLYHAYSNRAENFWYFIILCFPLVGSLFYLFKNFGNRNNLNNISEGLKHVVNKNYKIEQLEKELSYTDTVKNKVALADEYYAIKEYQTAEDLYKTCLTGLYADDPEIIAKSIKANYLLENYQTVIDKASLVQEDKSFKKSNAKILWALALNKLGKQIEAKKRFEEMNHSFVNYEARLEYARFLLSISEKENAIDLLEELVKEINHMDRQDKTQKRSIIKEIEKEYNAAF